MVLFEVIHLATYGIKEYEYKTDKGTLKVGFYYPEVVWNLLEDAGNRGISTSEIREKTGISDQTIRNILKKFMLMNRVSRRNTKTTGIDNYKYKIKKRWLNIL